MNYQIVLVLEEQVVILFQINESIYFVVICNNDVVFQVEWVKIMVMDFEIVIERFDEFVKFYCI